MNVHADEHKCFMCKKWFFSTDISQWAYKMPYKGNTKFFCSWPCLREFEKRENEKRLKRKHDKWMVKADAE